MSNVIDVIFVISDMQAAVSTLAIIDEDKTILQYDDNGNPTASFNSYWRVVTQAGLSRMFNVRFLKTDYDKITHESVSGFTILVAGYPQDDIEQMLIDQRTRFGRFNYNIEAGGPTWIDIDLEEDDPRIEPTQESFQLYRQFWPETISTTDPDGNIITIKQGHFSNHGL